MATEHVDIVDPEIHEPKGVAAAGANEQYFADGLGSGSWQKNLNTTHGDMIVTSNTTATVTSAAADSTLATDSDYTKITAGWTLAHGEGITLSTDEMVFSVAGDYHISFWADAKVPKNNNFIGIKYAVNDTAPYSNRKIIAQSTTVNDYLNVSGAGLIVSLNVNDTLSMYLASTQADSIVVQEAGIVAFLIHPGN